MDNQPHSVRSYDEEINGLNLLIITMATACSKQLVEMKQALASRDGIIGRNVAAKDDPINELHQEIENTVIKILARRQPMAQDLRHVLTVMKISRELERIGDYAANVAKRVDSLSSNTFEAPERMLIEMAETADSMLGKAIEAFLHFDVDTALSVWNMDDEMDAAYASIIKLVQQEMTSDKERITEGTQLNYMARCLERIGDHIINMTEEIYFMTTGKNFSSHVAPGNI